MTAVDAAGRTSPSALGSDQNPGRRRWRAFGVGGLVLIVANLISPWSVFNAILYLALGFASVVAMAFSAISASRTERLPWRLFTAALSLFFVGDLLFYFYDVVEGVARPFPSLADALYLSSYPFMIVGTLVLIRRRGRVGPATLIDAIMIALGVGILFWVFVIEPIASAAHQPLANRLISTAYPVMDVLLLVVAARLGVMSTGRRPVFSYLGLGVVGLLAADASSGVIQLTRVFHAGSLVDAGWMCFYFCWGMSALHSSARTGDEPRAELPAESTWARLLILGGACVLAPTVLTVRWLDGVQKDAPELFAGSMALFGLALGRMFVLSRALASTAARERSLRNSAAFFVAAIDANGVRAAALDAVRAVVHRDDAVLALLEVDGETTVTPFAGTSGEAVRSHEALRPPTAFGELEARAIRLVTDHGASHIMSTGLYAPSGLQGVLAIGAGTPFATGLATVLDTLGSQIGLALESAALAADLLRREGDERFRSLIQNSLELITVIDGNAIIKYQSPSVTQVLGYDDTSLIGTSLLDLVHPHDGATTVNFLDRVTTREGSTVTTGHRLRGRHGVWIDSETVGTNLLNDPSVRGIVLTTRDVSERQAFEARLSHQAFHDPLTGLANRSLFNDRAENSIAQGRRTSGSVGVIFLDLDDYKTVNDSFGHHAGDEVLVMVAARLALSVRSGDTIARLGGDEFAVLLPNLPDRGIAIRIAKRISAALDQVFILDAGEVFIGASLGIAFADGRRDGDGDIGHEELLRNADIAMYAAKSRGKRRYEVFEGSMHRAARARLQLKADLQHALDHDEFILYFQPILCAANKQLVGVEALIRWVSAERGLVEPDDFIPMCEENGLILPIGRWVLDAALGQAKSWSFAERSLTMSVNISAMQLQSAGLPAEIVAALTIADLPGTVLALELTESMIMRDVDASIAVLDELRSFGVRLVIDDFGTGYSSLSYLRQLPLNGLKIDKTFVDEMGSPPGGSLLVATVIDLARSLGLQTTAEGVESEHQFEQLQQMGCDLAQGYLFSRPLPAAQLEMLLPAYSVASQ